MRGISLLGVLTGVGLAAALSAPVLAGATPLTTVRVASGLTLPLFVTHAPGDYDRIYIVEQRSGNVGRIRVLNIPGNTLNAAPFLSVSPVSTGSEQGLLGLAFHPRYNDSNNARFYINYTNSAGDTIIAEYRAQDPNTADPNPVRQVAFIDQPFSNHNGGWIGFAPDDTEGYLYIAMGDGGSANDPGNRAQNLSILLGKMLRIDVDGPDNIPSSGDEDEFPLDANINWSIPPSNPFVGEAGDDAIWQYGLRNPWRDSFDRLTGDLYIGDVGQNAWEEISFQSASSLGGENFAGRCMEANNCTGLTGCTCEVGCAGGPLTCPIWQYNHSGGNCSVTGGYVYRGCAMPNMNGIYFFADYCSAQIWSFVYNGGLITQFTNRTAELDPAGALTINSVTSFGEDAYGEIYICDQGGEVFKIVPNQAITDCNGNTIPDACDIASGNAADCNLNDIPDSCDIAGGTPDCNLNSVPDSCDIANGTSQDANGNGIPDECEKTPCPDLDGDNDTDQSDLGILLGDWDCTSPPEPDCEGDLDGDNDTDQSDLGLLLAGWECGVP